MLEDDIIKFLKHDDFGATELYGKIIDYIDTVLRDTVCKFKTFLPAKAKKFGYPHFLWICPSIHKNYENNTLRKKFGGQLELQLRGRPYTTVLKLKQIWEPNNDTLVSSVSSDLTNTGQCTLWQAINKSIAFADKIVFNQASFTEARQRIQNRRSFNQNQGQRQRDITREDIHRRHNGRRSCCHRRRLPPPPAHK